MNKNEVQGSFSFFWGGAVLEDKDWFGRVNVPGKASLSKSAFRLHEFHEDRS